MSSPDGQWSRITVEERAALAAAATGLAVAEVAERLGYSPEVVRRLLESVMVKLGAHSKLEAIVVARRAGRIELL